MTLMTDSLKEIAGTSLRQWLSKFTGSPIKAINSGIIFTLIVQSSTATTLATIGFVSASVLTFSQSIGVIVGANIGTTSTGWMVALLGVKFSIGQFALPFIALGALLKVLGGARWSLLGLVLAGFGLIFYGIELLQIAMADLSKQIDLSIFTTSTFFAKLLLVLVGLIMTIILQSSSAAITTTIAALASQMIQLEQALFLIIGQNIGTVATAILASLSTTANAKRTALSHLLFNVIAAIFAFFILVPMILWGYGNIKFISSFEQVIIVAAFHTVFSLCGALLFMPFLEQVKALIYKLIPSDEDALLTYLDDSSLSFPSVAIANAKNVIFQSISLQLNWIASGLKEEHIPSAQQIKQQDVLIERLEEYLSKIIVVEKSKDQYDLFQLLRIMVYLKVFRSDIEQMAYVKQLRTQPALFQIALDYLDILGEDIHHALNLSDSSKNKSLLSELLHLKKWNEEHRDQIRETIHEYAASNHLSASQTIELLASQRWLVRFIAHHQRFMNVLSTQTEVNEPHLADVEHV
ncbi:Na/Pi symporter [Acinetobacter sp. ANC 7201]|nr:Na/Pi symporter [Acinetobacter sp. ANC 7201]